MQFGIRGFIENNQTTFVKKLIVWTNCQKKTVADKKDNQQTITLVFRKKKLDTGKT